MLLGGKSSNNRRGRTRFNKPTLLYYRSSTKTGQSNQDSKRNISGSKKNPIRYAFNAIIVFASIAVFLYSVSLDSNPVIVFQQKSGLFNNINTYQESIQQILKEAPFSRSKLTINTSGLAKTIENRHPEIANATVVVPFFSRQPKVILTPVTPVFIVNSGNNSYVVDQFGIAIARVQELNNVSKMQLITVNDDARVEITKDKAVLSQEQTNFIREVIEQLKAKNIGVSSISIPVSAYDLQVKLKDKAYAIKMNMSGDARSQVGRYLAAEKEASKAGRGIGEYIDVRVDERAYIK